LGSFSARKIGFVLSILALGINSSIPCIVSIRSEKEKSDHRAVDALYRISAFASSEPDPKLALEGILDEVINVFGASSASICLLNADSDKLSIEVGCC
jgi:nitrate/nitrite-specific signal transduction histidine kinase